MRALALALAWLAPLALGDTSPPPTTPGAPGPSQADVLFQQAKRRFDTQQWAEARLLLDEFLTRFPTEARAPKAQLLVALSDTAQDRWANAVGAFTKLIDNYPTSELLPEAFYGNGVAFRALRYCSDARIYFRELIRRFPDAAPVKDARTQLERLAREIGDDRYCVN